MQYDWRMRKDKFSQSKGNFKEGDTERGRKVSERV